MSLASEIIKLTTDKATTSLAHSYGLAVNTVSWEDTGRTKGSCWGPNISDMTLYAESFNMPVLRKPNFADVTADRNIEDFMVAVGNESGNPLKQISFKEYLENLDKYSKNPNIKPLLLERDSKLLVSSQACMLPLSDGEVEFCVQLYNYQSAYDSSDPAVLVVVASAQGTSAQIIYGNTKLYMNDNGRSFNFKAKRLSDDRSERGVSTSGPMSSDEKNRNVLFIYQIPLKQKPRPMRRAGAGAMMLYDSFEGCSGMEKCMALDKKVRSTRGLEKAVLSKGRDMGAFTGTNGLTLERDDRFPIRCTVQYYNVTDVAIITEPQMKELSDTINTVYSTAPFTGSLVLSESTRVTEPKTLGSKMRGLFSRFF